MASVDTFQTLLANFKSRYGNLDNVIVDSMKFLKLCPFDKKNKTGKNFVVAVQLANEQGVTYGSTDDNMGALLSLNPAISLTLLDATIQPNVLLLRSQIGYEAYAAGENGDLASFESTSTLVTDSQMKSLQDRLEISCIYGSSPTGLGTLHSSANVDSTDTVVTITTGQWATGIWLGKEGANRDAYHGSTQINTNAALVITGINASTRAITVSGNSTDIAALDTYIAANPDAARFLFYGAYGNETIGLDAAVLSNTTLWGISNSYLLWQSTVYDVLNATLTMGKVEKGISSLVQKGLSGVVNVIENPDTWATQNIDLAALRRFTDDGDSGKLGVKSIEYDYADGVVKLIGLNKIKEGEAFAFPDGELKRIGSADVGFKLPGEQYGFLHVPDKMGYEQRMFSCQGFFTTKVALLLKFKNIVNS
jgi:hypothetical protein